MPIAYKVSLFSHEIEEVEYFKITKKRIYLRADLKRFAALVSRDATYYTLRENAVDKIRRRIEDSVEAYVAKIQGATSKLAALNVRSKAVEETLLKAANDLDYWKTTTFQGGEEIPEGDCLDIGVAERLAKRVLNSLPPSEKEFGYQMRLYRFLYEGARENFHDDFYQEYNTPFVPTPETYQLLGHTPEELRKAEEALGLKPGEWVGQMVPETGKATLIFESLLSLEDMRDKLRLSFVSSLAIQTVARKADYTGKPDENVDLCYHTKEEEFPGMTEETGKKIDEIYADLFPDNLGFEDDVALRSYMAGRMDGTEEEVTAYVFLRESNLEPDHAIQAIKDPSIVAIIQDILQMIEEIPKRIGPHLSKVGNEKALDDVLEAMDAQESIRKDNDYHYLKEILERTGTPLNGEQLEAYLFLRKSGMKEGAALEAIEKPNVVEKIEEIRSVIRSFPDWIRVDPLDCLADEEKAQRMVDEVVDFFDDAQEGANYDQRVFGFLNVWFFAYNRPFGEVVDGAFPDLPEHSKKHLREKYYTQGVGDFFFWFSKLDEDYQGRVLRWINDNYDGVSFEKAQRIAAVTIPTIVGVEAGEVCNRDGCKGEIEEKIKEVCTCHIAPPCSGCTSGRFECLECGWEEADA